LTGSSQRAGVSGTTRLVGLIGWPVAHTLSPAMHNAAAAQLGLDLLYVPLAVQPSRLAVAIAGLPALGFLGVNVTVPHKENVIPLLDEVDPAARAIGAVNTIVIGNGRARNGERRPGSQLQSGRRAIDEKPARLAGYNTDWLGFMGDLADLGLDPGGRDCWVLGAGGSARAVIYGLVTGGATVTVFARREEQARTLAGDLLSSLDRGKIATFPWIAFQEKAGDARPDLIVNTTPVGMAPDEDSSPWPDGIPVPAGCFVYDLVYNPRETKLIRQAKSSAASASGGLGMLVRQGAEAFHLWTGQRPDLKVMKEATGSILY